MLTASSITMRSFQLVCVFLCVGVANAQLGGLISGLISGLVKGGIEGTVGAFAPLGREAIGVGFNLLQASIRSGFIFMEQMFQKAPVFMSTAQSLISQLINTNMQMFQNLGGMAQQTMSSIMGMFSSGMSGALSMFGGMANHQQRAVIGLFSRVDSAATTVLKLRMNKLAAATHELPQLRLALESPHKNQKALFDNVRSKAPIIGDTLKTVYEKASDEFHRGFGQLESGAQDGLKKIKGLLSSTLKNIQKTVGSVDAQQKKQFGSSLHLMNNAMHVLNVAL
ncbi:hypothetical protein M3Y95_01038400 [Aphelenchoides besseyi]|nr:hypothetical protein M3Y95_01038400 [Aphelenchoides besseyi]